MSLIRIKNENQNCIESKRLDLLENKKEKKPALSKPAIFLHRQLYYSGIPNIVTTSL